MEYYSTAGKSPNVGLRQAVLAGKAPDGGLYLPDRIPLLPRAFYNNMPDMTIRETAYVVANTLFSDEVDSEILSNVACDTFSFDVPLRRLTDSISSLELFHGPTGSFNDIGARFLAGLLPHLRPDTTRPVNFLMATSGDSGAAVARALHGLSGAKVTVLFPARRVSELQLAQLASLGGNVTAVEVNGTIDECRAMVDNLFASRDLVEQARLTPASSVNIARLLPQIFYYFHACASIRREKDSRKIVVAVPGGNLGNLVSGLIAKKMGLPIDRFIVSNNVNSAFVRYLESGKFVPHDLIATRSTSLDVSRPSNFPRIQALYHDNLSLLRADVTGRTVTDDEIARATELARQAGYPVESGSATALMALNEAIDPATETGIFFNIASPSKTLEGELSAEEQKLIARPQRTLKIGKSIAALKNFLLTNV